MKVNIWKTIYTNIIYEMPLDWVPLVEGWTLIKTIEKD